MDRNNLLTHAFYLGLEGFPLAIQRGAHLERVLSRAQGPQHEENPSCNRLGWAWLDVPRVSPGEVDDLSG